MVPRLVKHNHPDFMELLMICLNANLRMTRLNNSNCNHSRLLHTALSPGQQPLLATASTKRMRLLEGARSVLKLTLFNLMNII